jgi:asparagine synthase (glutamine-hydrolysing)
MSGIAGVFYRKGQALDPKVLDQMLHSMSHRGPDGAGAWRESSIGLAHRAFHTTPESINEKPPVMDRSGDYALTADARIDNREELLDAVGLDRLSGRSVGDGELILAAYKKWGEKCPQWLLGDFAFAIWDRRRRVLFCARDHMGLKPFYYHLSGHLFVFASEIKALLCVPHVPRRLNEVMVADHLARNSQDKTITFYKDVLRLPPAHSITVDAEGTKVREYWELDPSRELRLGSNDEYAEAFREVFEEAVRCRLRSAFPVGSDLSGGLDSSSVTCMARDVLGENGGGRLHTFSAIPEHVAESDESAYIDAVLKQGGLHAHKLAEERMSPLSNLQNILRYTDQPPYLAGAPFNWGIRGAAHRNGVRVVLTGLDGDTVVDETATRLLDLAIWGRWMTLATQIDALSRTSGWSRRRILHVLVARPLLPEYASQYWRTLRGTHPPESTGLVIRPEFAQRVGLEERTHVQDLEISAEAPLSRANHLTNLDSGLWTRSFELHNSISAAFPVEDCHPYFDRRLVEFCLALPSAQKLDNGYGRIVMRRALDGVLPEKVRWRYSKGNYTPTFNYALLMHDRRELQEVLAEDLHLVDSYIDTKALIRAYHDWLLGKVPGASHIVKAVYLMVWLRQSGIEP